MVESLTNQALPWPDPQQPYDVEKEDSEEKEEEEEGENNFLPIILPQTKQLSEPTPSDVVAGVLGKLHLAEVVVKFALRIESGLVESP